MEYQAKMGVAATHPGAIQACVGHFNLGPVDNAFALSSARSPVTWSRARPNRYVVLSSSHTTLQNLHENFQDFLSTF